jgi:hypothetical protein
VYDEAHCNLLLSAAQQPLCVMASVKQTRLAARAPAFHKSFVRTELGLGSIIKSKAIESDQRAKEINFCLIYYYEKLLISFLFVFAIILFCIWYLQ